MICYDCCIFRYQYIVQSPSKAACKTVFVSIASLSGCMAVHGDSVSRCVRADVRFGAVSCRGERCYLAEMQMIPIFGSLPQDDAIRVG